MASRRTISVLAALAVDLRTGDGRTDGELLREFLQKKSETAFAAIVRRHAAMVLGVCRRILGHADDADDAFQATFLVLATKAKSLGARATVGDWLHGVARRTALNARRRAMRRRNMETLTAQTAVSQDAATDEMLPILDEELARLPEKYRQPIVLCDLEGRSRKLAAEQLGWPEGTVAGRLARGRELLARRLSKRGVGLAVAAMIATCNKSAAATVAYAVVQQATKGAVLTLSGNLPKFKSVSQAVFELSQGVIEAMLLKKLKIGVVTSLTVCLLATGFSLLSRPRSAQATDPAVQEKGPDKNDPQRATPALHAATIDDNVTIGTIRAAWHAREAKIKSIPFRLQWNEKQMRADIPNEPEPKNSEYSSMIIARGNKLRYEWSVIAGTDPFTKTIVWQGDGAKVLHDYGPAKRPSGNIWDAHTSFVDFGIRVMSLGILPSNAGFTEVDLSEYSLRPERQLVNGVSCYVLESKNDSSMSDLYLNPDIGFLVQRIVGISGRQVDYEYALTEKIGWMPHGWQIKIMGPGPDAVSFRLVATQGKTTVIKEPQAATFDIAFPPGTVVRKSSDGEVQHFTVDQDGNLAPLLRDHKR